jgi:hypothetical protein
MFINIIYSVIDVLNRCRGLHAWMSGLMANYHLLDITSREKVVIFLGLNAPANALEDARNRFIIQKLNQPRLPSIMSEEGTISYRHSSAPDDVSLQDLQSDAVADEAVLSPSISAMAFPLEVALAGYIYIYIYTYY